MTMLVHSVRPPCERGTTWSYVRSWIDALRAVVQYRLERGTERLASDPCSQRRRPDPIERLKFQLMQPTGPTQLQA